MNITILAAELAGDPLGMGYSSMSDAGVSDALNARTRIGYREVPASDVRMYVLLNGLWPALQNVAVNSTNSAHKGTAITILQTLGAGAFDAIRMNRPEIASGVAAMLQTMVDAGVMTAEHRTAMMAMGETFVSRAEELGLGHVDHIQVSEARALQQETS